MSTLSPESLSLEATSGILRGLPVGVFVARAPGGEHLYTNEAFDEIMGMGPADGAKAGSYSQPYGIFTRDGLPYPEEGLPFAKALKARAVVMVDDIVIHRRDGKRVHVRAYGKPLFGANDVIEAVMVTFFDITGERHAQLRLDLAVKYAPIIIFTLDANGVVTLSEGAGLKALGWRPGELVGKSLFEVYRGYPEVVFNTQRALAGESFTMQTRVGDAVLEGWMGPLKDATGKVTGIIGVTNDVTERHAAQAAMFRSERMAAMGTLAASVAHEINNPLAYVLEGLRSIERELGAGTSPKVRQLLGDVKEGAERVRTITSDLQTFTRRDDEPLCAVDVSCAVRTALQMLRTQLEARARVALDLSSHVRVVASERRLVQIFMNLLLNAVHAVRDVERPGGHEIRITTRAEGADAVIEVSDTGPGVKAGLAERIFEPFVTTKPVGEGTGLGLFVCRNLVSELKGRIEVDQRREGGAVFRVRLPAEVAKQTREGAHILIIDDNVNLGRVMASALELAKHHSVVVQSGREAIERLTHGESYDVVFCDLMMKDVSGMDVYEELKAKKPGAEAALVFMTGGAFTDRARRFLSSVPNTWLQKPFDICEQVARLLEGKGV
ncbi:MAG: response regulator [Myxococcaceae bacterium]|nr:response regulator [Myxococcaceae bacterium]